MTERWKSNSMYHCDVCGCWMQDTKAAKQNHERGMGHQDKLAKKLRAMAKKSETDKADAKYAELSLAAIETAAAKQYAKDKAEAAATVGSWTWDEGANYYYHAMHRWYFDPKTGWYYGGDPVEWTQSPATLPAASRFGVAPHEGGPIPPGSSSIPAAAADPASAAGSRGGSSGAAGATAAGGATATIKRVIAVPKHPLAGVGGYQAPLEGRIGGALGIGKASVGAGGAGEAGKRKRDGEGLEGKPAKVLSAEDAAMAAKREEARLRVQQRTASQFGYS